MNNVKSKLCKIESPPSNPIDLFEKIVNNFKAQTVPFFIPMNLATINREHGVLNRTVVFRGLSNENNIIFITERNTQKYKDIQENPKIAVTFLFTYNQNEKRVTYQIRINGTAIELSESEIQNFWNDEPVYAKVRSIICECGKPVDWDQLNMKHDEVLKAYEEGRIKLDKTETYTAFKIVPDLIDFYYASGMAIADRVRYTKEKDNTWTHTHVYT